MTYLNDLSDEGKKCKYLPPFLSEEKARFSCKSPGIGMGLP